MDLTNIETWRVLSFVVGFPLALLWYCYELTAGKSLCRVLLAMFYCFDFWMFALAK